MIRQLKDPIDQLRHKSERLRKLADQEKKFREKFRESCKVIAEAEEEAADLREKIHNLPEETERVKIEQRVLVLPGSGGHEAELPAAPVDFGVAVEAMRLDFTAMFQDPLLPTTAAGKRPEGEAGFVTMANLVCMLSALSA